MMQVNEKAIAFNDRFLPHDGFSDHTTALLTAVGSRAVSCATMLLDAGAVLEDKVPPEPLSTPLLYPPLTNPRSSRRR